MGRKRKEEERRNREKREEQGIVDNEEGKEDEKAGEIKTLKTEEKRESWTMNSSEIKLIL